MTHLLMNIGLFYLLITQYLKYSSVRNTSQINVDMAIGACLAYLFIWGFAYWLAYTSNKRVLNTMIGFIAIILAPFFVNLLAFSLLIVMYVVRRIGEKQSDLAV